MTENQYAEENIKTLLLEFYSNQQNMNLIDYYSRTTFFDLIKKSRSETVHSAFLAWVLEGSDFPGKGISSNIMHFLQLLVKRKNKQADADFDDVLKDSICSGYLEINELSIETEKPVSDFYSEADSKDRLDIYIHCRINNGKELEIFIENKVGSKEGGKQDTNAKEGYKSLQQTERYYTACHASNEDKVQLFVYLSAISESRLEYLENAKSQEERKGEWSTCTKYLQICYQDILDYILLPLQTMPNISTRSLTLLNEYIECLGVPALGEDESNAKQQIIMATISSEKEKFNNFFEDDKNRILNLVLDVVALKKKYKLQIEGNDEWLSIDKILEQILKDSTQLESLKSKLEEENFIKIYKQNYGNYKKGDVVQLPLNSNQQYKLKQLLKEKQRIEELDSNVINLLENFWERNQRLLLVALRVLSDDPQNEKKVYYDKCYRIFTNRDDSKFAIRSESGLGKTEVVERFIAHLCQNKFPNENNLCDVINEYLKDISLGPSKKGVLITKDTFKTIREKDDEIKENYNKKDSKLASDRYREVTVDINSSKNYYVSTQWGGQYNSTRKVDNFPLLWKKIEEYNRNATNKFEVEILR